MSLKLQIRTRNNGEYSEGYGVFANLESAKKCIDRLITICVTLDNGLIEEKQEWLMEILGIEDHEENAMKAKLMDAAQVMLAALENSLVDEDEDHARQMVEQAIIKAKGGL